MSIMTIFQCLTGEGWSKMMYIYWDAKNTTLVVIYFVSLILFGVFFILNLFLAVISDSFSKEQQKEKNLAYRQEIREAKILKIMKFNEQQQLLAA